jgi:hypothetical protein
MVCLFGRAISEHRLYRIHPETNYLTYKMWIIFSATSLLDEALIYIIFRSLTKSLLKTESTAAVNLLRLRFVGFLDPITVNDLDQPLADFLTSEGVLVKPDIRIRQYQVASPIIDRLVRQFVIPSNSSSGSREWTANCHGNIDRIVKTLR